MTSTNPKTGTAVIMGAGPAGLATGYALARAGWHVQVYEQASMVGGLARTVGEDGFLYDIGGHRWFTKKDELNVFLADLLAEDLVWVDRVSRIYFQGKFVSYPLKAGEVLRSIGPGTGAKAVTDFVTSQASQLVNGKPIVSMEDAYVAQFGRTLYELFFKRYSEKVWGDECSNLSGDWVTQRSRGLSLLTTLKDAVKRTDGKVESLVERFMYPRLGYGQISEKMAADIERRGGSVNLGWRVVRADHDGKSIRSLTVSNGSEERVVEGDAFVSSIPMTELIQILRPQVDPSLVEGANELTFRDIITVHIKVDRPSVTNDTWVYVHDPRVSFARLHEPRNWSPEMAPKGKTSLVLELFCQRTDPYWSWADGDLVKLVERDLIEYLRFLEPGEVLGGFAERSKDAYPRYSIGYKEKVDAIKAQLRSYENLNIVGRGGTFRYNNADHSIETGLLAARHILGEGTKVDVDAVNSENEYLEERRIPVTGVPASATTGVV